MPEFRLGLYLQDDHPLPDAVKLVQYAEMRGFESVWQSESRLARDVVVPMAAYAATTYRIRIGAGVMNVWTRNAATIASTFLSLDDLAPDRIVCGLGLWHEPLASMTGIQRHKPLLALREVTEAVHGLLAMQTVTYRGELVSLNGVSLDVTRGRREKRQVPIYFGATGAYVAALAGEIADGLLMNYLTSPSYNLHVIEELERGARKANRKLNDIERPQLILCSVDRDRSKALDAARRVVTRYIAQQPTIMRQCGVRQELIDEVTQMLNWAQSPKQFEDVLKLVPDDVVQLVTASGTPDEARAKVSEYLASGATSAVLYPLGDDVRFLIDAFTDRYAS